MNRCSISLIISAPSNPSNISVHLRNFIAEKLIARHWTLNKSTSTSYCDLPKWYCWITLRFPSRFDPVKHRYRTPRTHLQAQTRVHASKYARNCIMTLMCKDNNCITCRCLSGSRARHEILVPPPPPPPAVRYTRVARTPPFQVLDLIVLTGKRAAGIIARATERKISNRGSLMHTRCAVLRRARVAPDLRTDGFSDGKLHFLSFPETP